MTLPPGEGAGVDRPLPEIRCVVVIAAQHRLRCGDDSLRTGRQERRSVPQRQHSGGGLVTADEFDQPAVGRQQFGHVPGQHCCRGGQIGSATCGVGQIPGAVRRPGGLEQGLPLRSGRGFGDAVDGQRIGRGSRAWWFGDLDPRPSGRRPRPSGPAGVPSGGPLRIRGRQILPRAWSDRGERSVDTWAGKGSFHAVKVALTLSSCQGNLDTSWINGSWVRLPLSRDRRARRRRRPCRRVLVAAGRRATGCDRRSRKA